MYVLMDKYTGNVIGEYPTLIALVQAAFALGQANPWRLDAGYPNIVKEDIVAYQEGNDE